MVSLKTLRKRLSERRQELNNLDKSYVDFRIGEKQYQEERPLLLGKIAELEDLCHTHKK